MIIFKTIYILKVKCCKCLSKIGNFLIVYWGQLSSLDIYYRELYLIRFFKLMCFNNYLFFLLVATAQKLV